MQLKKNHLRVEAIHRGILNLKRCFFKLKENKKVHRFLIAFA